MNGGTHPGSFPYQSEVPVGYGMPVGSHMMVGPPVGALYPAPASAGMLPDSQIRRASHPARLHSGRNANSREVLNPSGSLNVGGGNVVQGAGLDPLGALAPDQLLVMNAAAAAGQLPLSSPPLISIPSRPAGAGGALPTVVNVGGASYCRLESFLSKPAVCDVLAGV